MHKFWMEESPYLIAAIPTHQLHVIWPLVVPHLEKVVDVAHGDLTLTSIRNKLTSGGAQLMAISRGNEIVAATTVEIVTMESGKRCLATMIIGGADSGEWGDQYLTKLQELAREALCDCVRGCGRLGWARKWGHKIKPIMTVYEMELDA